jgi:hypothetical protein
MTTTIFGRAADEDAATKEVPEMWVHMEFEGVGAARVPQLQVQVLERETEEQE